MKHIIWGTNWYPHRENPTLGNFVQRHAEAASLFNQISVIVPLPADAFSIEREKKNENLTEYRTYYPRKLKIWGQITAFKKVLQELPPADVFHGHALISAYWMYKLVKAPGVLTEHWTGFHNHLFGELPYLKRRAMKKAGKRLTFALPVTRQLGNRMQQLGLIKKFEVVGNVVHTEQFTPTPYPDYPVRFLHVSTLHDPQKNVSGLLRVAKHLQDEGLTFFLQITGDGDIHPHIKYANSLGIRKEFIGFAGAQNPAGIAQMMRESHALVLFSHFENFPCVIVEAWASGRPIISTNVGGIAEHTTPDKGWLLKPKDEDHLFEIMKERCLNQELPPPDNLAAYAKKHFSMEAIGKAFDQIYTKC